MIDSHCHLADEAFASDLEAVVARASAAGVTSALCILDAGEPAELERSAIVSAAWPAVAFATGIHPHHAGAYAGRVDEAATTTRAAAGGVHAVAIGEIGLDYHYDFAPRDVQQAVFAAQVALAVELNRPVVIHTREAFDDTVAILREAGAGRVHGVMHCFSGGPDDLRRALDLDFYISFAGMLTFAKAEDIRERAVSVPLDRLLVETDAPYLAPVPNRGRRNEPAWVALTLARLAEVRRMERNVLADRVSANFRAFAGSAR